MSVSDKRARLLGQSHSGLVDARGDPLVSPKQRPLEQLTAVKFLRTMAEEAGGLKSPRGQALHRAAGHFITLHEELRRTALLKDLSGEHSRERLAAAAEGIYNVARQKMIEATGGERVPDAWEVMLRDRPGEAEGYIHMAIAALGGPVYVPPCTEEETAECKFQDS